MRNLSKICEPGFNNGRTGAGQHVCALDIVPQVSQLQRSTMELSATELVAEIERGNQQAEAVFLSQMRKPVFTMLHVRTRTIADADDLTQDTLETSLLKIRGGELREPAAVRGFVMGIAKRKFSAWVRRRRPDEDDPDMLPTQEERLALDDHELVLLIEAVLQQLVERDREILIRHFLLQEPKLVTCEFLDITPDHYDKVLHRAKRRFRDRAPAILHDYLGQRAP